MFQRKILSSILQQLDNQLILLLIGARQTGKTTLLKQIQTTIQDKKTYFINLENPDFKRLLNQHPDNIFAITGSNNKEEQCIFIDEIQYLDNPTNFLKYIYDEYKETIKLIVSGSSSFYIDQKFKDSLIGRKKVFEIYTLDFHEFLWFKQEPELSQLLIHLKPIPLLYQKKIEQYMNEYLTYGGYPEIVLLPGNEEKISRLSDYTYDFIKKDIADSQVGNTDKFFSILKILSHHCGELLNMNELANTFNISLPTVEKYISILQKSFYINLIRPRYRNIRKELSKMPKVYFLDLGLRNSLIGNFQSIHDRIDKGPYLENTVYRELLFIHGREGLRYRRTQAKHEVDFIVNESYALEVKFSKSMIKESKYKLFQELYPEIPLKYITYEELLPLICQF